MMNKTEKEICISDIIKKRKYNAAIKQAYILMFIKLFVLIVVALLLFTQVFILTRCQGMDMFPSVKDGDLVLAYRLERNFQKGDIVIYKVEGTKHIGRIVALENDNVSIEQNGNLLVNGTMQSGEILFVTHAKEGITYPYTVPEKQVFIIGDYRTQATDSRDYGGISLKDIEGKVITLMRRREL